MAVSVTISPVTQTAEVEVKRASKKGSPLPSFVENPMERRTVPSAITKTKLSRIVRGGFAENFFQKEEIFEVFSNDLENNIVLKTPTILQS